MRVNTSMLLLSHYRFEYLSACLTGRLHVSQLQASARETASQLAARDAEISSLRAELICARSRETELERRVDAAQYVARECK